MLDLGPPARQMANLLDRVADGQLTAPTPCDEYTLGDLIDHVGGLSQAFTAAARKELGPESSQGPSATPLTWARIGVLAFLSSWLRLSKLGATPLPGRE